MSELVYREGEQRIQREAIFESIPTARVIPASAYIVGRDEYAKKNPGVRVPIQIRVQSFRGPRVQQYTVCCE